MIFSRPAGIEYGDKFGKLTVLKKERRKDRTGVLYRVGCACGNSGMMVTASALISGRRTACVKCSSTRCAKTSA